MSKQVEEAVVQVKYIMLNEENDINELFEAAVNNLFAIDDPETLREAILLLDDRSDIVCPSVVLMGAQDGVDPPTSRLDFSSHFKQLRSVSTVEGVGHNLPQEAPTAFAEAVLSLVDT